jgi:carbamate kinase
VPSLASAAALPGSTPLIVVALGGNAISPPRGALSFAVERSILHAAAGELAGLARRGHRLLVVHGNGPQVGRLLAAYDAGEPGNLDVHVAQTQGELGYLIAEAVDASLGADACAALITRVLVDPDDPAFAHPTKPVGAVLAEPPPGVAAVRLPNGGWRRVVASPRPRAVIESGAIESLLSTHHVIAGGGGGVALAGRAGGRQPRAAVVDKDWVAALLAVCLAAHQLVFVTDVTHAFDRFGGAEQEAIHFMTVSAARARLAAGVFAPGSMAPKVESAIEFVEASGRAALIATVGHVEAALAGTAGTTIHP